MNVAGQKVSFLGWASVLSGLEISWLRLAGLNVDWVEYEKSVFELG